MYQSILSYFFCSAILLMLGYVCGSIIVKPKYVKSIIIRGFLLYAFIAHIILPPSDAALASLLLALSFGLSTLLLLTTLPNLRIYNNSGFLIVPDIFVDGGRYLRSTTRNLQSASRSSNQNANGDRN